MSCLLFASRTTRRRTASAQWFLQDLRWKVDTAPLFYACPGRKIQLQIHPLNLWKPVASCRPCVLSDCIRPRTGNGRNRYVPAASACRGSVVNRYARAPAGAAGRDGLTWHGYYPAVLFFGLFSQFHDYNRNVISLRRHSANGKVRLLHSCELIRPKLLRPFVEFHKAIFWVGGWDPYSLPLFSNRSSKTIICSFSRGSTERCPAVQSGAAELAACARAFGMRLCRAKQEIPPFSRS